MKISGIILMFMGLGLFWLCAAGAEEKFSREEVEHAFGTDPSYAFYPATAIDTNETPNVVLKPIDRNDTPLKYYEIVPENYLLFGNIAEVDENNRGFNGNAGFVVTSEGVVVIDALGTPKLGERMIASIRTVTDKPIKYLILTHNHPDHAYGAIAFQRLGGVTIIGHEGTLKYLDSDRIAHSVAYRKTFILDDMQGFQPVRPDILIGGERFSKYSFSLGNHSFDVYNAGAHHSYGDLVVHQRPEQIVWISDLAFNQRVTFIEDGHTRLAIEAQEWLLESFPKATLMVPGHGSAQTAPFPMVEQTRNYLQQLRAGMAEAIENGVEMQDAIDKSDFPEWEGVRLYELNHRRNLNFVYREMEAELF